MDWILGVAMIIAFGPVLISMDAVLKKYTYPRVDTPFFKDSTLFAMLVIGIIAGAILYAVTQWMGLLGREVSIVYMVLIAILQLMIMVVVMNLKRFRGKSDSIFYGFSLGLGMAAGMAWGFAYNYCALAAGRGVTDWFDVLFYAIVLGISLTFILGACGTIVGEGIARHYPMQFVLQAAIPLAAYNMLFAASSFLVGIMWYVVLIVMLVVSAYYFYKNLYVNLPNIVREVLKMNGIRRDDIPK